MVGLAVGAAAKTAPSGLIPSTVALPFQGNGPQFLQADARGEIYLLRGDTYDIYAFERGEISKPKRLAMVMPPESRPTAAAMSWDASSWALVASNRVFYWVDGRQQSTPDVGWLVTSVALQRNTPIAGVLPMAVGQPTLKRAPSPPLALRLGDDAWETFIPGKLPKRSQAHDPIDALFADYSVKLATDRQGRAWAAYPFTGRIVRFTASGRLDSEIVLGSGVAQHREEAAQKRALLASLRKQGYNNPKATVGVFTAQLLLRGFTFGQDGTLYTLVGPALTGGGMALGRLNLATFSFETTPVVLPDGGELSMAAGREGLFLATLSGSSDLWRFTWGQLEAAPWAEFTRFQILGSLEPGRNGIP